MRSIFFVDGKIYRIKKVFNLMFFAIILIKGHKVEFLCLKKRVWFYWECLLISCVFQLHDPC